MGYKYGVWYTYSKAYLSTKHQGHFTVACFMEKQDAVNLYHEIASNYGTTTDITIDMNNPVIFEANMYDDDDNNLYACGYNGENHNWKQLEAITSKYKCNFSHQPHTSVVYSNNEADVITHVHHINNNNTEQPTNIINCNLHVVNICNDNPIEWIIIPILHLQ